MTSEGHDPSILQQSIIVNSDNRNNTTDMNKPSNTDQNVDIITSQEQRVTPETPWKPLTRKQKAYADYLIEHPKASNTEAAVHAYDLSDPTTSTAATIAHENQRKPNIQAYMASQGHEASMTAIKLMRLSAKRANTTVKLKDGTEVIGRDALGWGRLAFDISEAVNDRVHGKAKTITESSNLNINIQTVLD